MTGVTYPIPSPTNTPRPTRSEPAGKGPGSEENADLHLREQSQPAAEALGLADLMTLSRARELTSECLSFEISQKRGGVQPLRNRVYVIRQNGAQPELSPWCHQHHYGDSDFLEAEEDFELHPGAAFLLTSALRGAAGATASRRREGARKPYHTVQPRRATSRPR